MSQNITTLTSLKYTNQLRHGAFKTPEDISTRSLESFRLQGGATATALFQLTPKMFSCTKICNIKRPGKHPEHPIILLRPFMNNAWRVPLSCWKRSPSAENTTVMNGVPGLQQSLGCLQWLVRPGPSRKNTNQRITPPSRLAGLAPTVHPGAITVHGTDIHLSNW